MEGRKLDTLETAMKVIAEAGDSKSYSMEAIYHAKEGRFEEAQECLENAGKALATVHAVQTSMIRGEMTGENKTEITLLMVHAQDHIMSAVTIRELATELVSVHEKISLAFHKEGETV
ncbi:MAG: phosphotransferase system cellobiose-specific component [Bacillota bacterium]|nr:phosphotransferase system cellobiose-specific component [Bacillota bacterium]